MEKVQIIINEFLSLRNEEQATLLARFFKTGTGEYGEGDMFLGIKVPVTRSLVKKYRNDVSIADIEILIDSPWHEIRLCGFLLLVELYQKSIKAKEMEVASDLVNFYIENIGKGNNWDLVDLVAYKILGDRVVNNPELEEILFELSRNNDSLWHQRVAMVSTFALIRQQKYDITFQLAEKYLSHDHDLIHKATGWMLREIGKRGGIDRLKEFLEKNKSRMPRTMLRYAIERFPENERQYFLSH